MSEELQQGVQPTPPQQGEQVNAEAVNSAEQKASSEAVQEEKPKAKETPEWATRRFNELTRKRYEAEARANVLEQELAKLRGGEQGDQQNQVKPEEVIKLAEQIAEQKARVQSFNKRCDDAVTQGEAEFKDEFQPAVRTLGALGALFDGDGKPTDFADSIMESEIPHKLLHHFGSNPEEAERVMSLPPKQQARAIALLEAQLSTQPPEKPAISKAPAPVRPVGGSKSAVSHTIYDAPDMDTYARLRQQQRAQQK